MIDWGKFSAKSLDFIFNSNARINIAHGSVRSSKTASCDVRWILYILNGPKGDLAMVGKTLATLQRNALNDIFDTVGPKNYRWINKQQGELEIMGRRVYCFGANNEESEGKIRGATFAGAYCDEASLYPRSFMDMLMTRLSIEGAKAFINCNPGDPDHWFYTEYIMNEQIEDKKIWHFTLDDNPNLPLEYRRSLEQSFRGVFYDRMILGLWVVAEGIIYRYFAEHIEEFMIDETPKDLLFSIIGVDFGGNGSGHAFNCTGFAKSMRKVYTLRDFFSKEEFDANQLADEFVKFVKQQIALGHKVLEVRYDSAETVLVRTFRNKLQAAGIGIPIKNAMKSQIWDRIRFYSLLFGTKAYFIHRSCTHTIDAFKKARWDPKHADERLDDLSTNIDNLDAQEYSTEPYQKKINDLLLLVGGTRDGTHG
jgi:PBSX family phage terminase large subunit